LSIQGCHLAAFCFAWMDLCGFCLGKHAGICRACLRKLFRKQLSLILYAKVYIRSHVNFSVNKTPEKFTLKFTAGQAGPDSCQTRPGIL